MKVVAENPYGLYIAHMSRGEFFPGTDIRARWRGYYLIEGGIGSSWRGSHYLGRYRSEEEWKEWYEMEMIE